MKKALDQSKLPGDRYKASSYNAPESKARILELIRDGYSVADSCHVVGKSEKTYYYYLQSDPDFKSRVDTIRAMQARKGTVNDENRDLSFPEFRRKFLKSETFGHQQNMVDLLEGRPPSWLHSSMVYEARSDQHIIVNMPPEHAKSMTITIDYTVYRICMDPGVRIKIVSKTQSMAKDFLYAIKQRLTNPMFAELQAAFAPPEGWKASADQWTQDKIFLSRESDQKDPTVEALGIGGQIYGARADLIILDDCVTLSNANEYEKQSRWIQQEVLTRVGPAGKILVVGTRVDPVDLYRELRSEERYPAGVSPWTYLAMPAVLEFHEDPTLWVTLWPRSDRPWDGSNDEPDEDSMYPRWSGKHLNKRRGFLDPKTWAMVYQQQDVQLESVFASDLVRGAVSGMRAHGVLVAGAPGHPGSIEGFYTICSMDPAMSGDTFSIAYSGDRASKRRYILDASRMTAPTPQRIRELIFSWTERFRPAVWVIEKNAFQLFLTQDEEINKFLANRGIRLVQHYTGNNKLDLEFGVASMAPLFGGRTAAGKPAGNNLIELPRTSDSEGTKALVEQLVTWSPGTKNKQDGPMALWFAETQMRHYLDRAGVYAGTGVKNPFATPIDLAKKRVVNLEEYQEALQKQARFL